MWRLIACKTYQDARELAKSLGFVSLERIGYLQEAEIAEVSWKATVYTADFSVRIAVAPVQANIEIDPATLEKAKIVPRKLARGQREALIGKLKADKAIKSYAPFGILVDTDTFIEYPNYPEDLGIDTFIMSAFESGSDIRRKIFTNIGRASDV